MKFKDFIMQEEMTAGDVASVESKLGDNKPIKHLQKGKRCKKHKRINCLECTKDNHGEG